MSERDERKRPASTEDVAETPCWTAGADAVEVAIDVPTAALVPWTGKEKSVGTLPVTSQDGVGWRFHNGTPVDPECDS